MLNSNLKVGMIIGWIDSPYIIISINTKGVLLKQKFSIGSTLSSVVPFTELFLYN